MERALHKKIDIDGASHPWQHRHAFQLLFPHSQNPFSFFNPPLGFQLKEREAKRIEWKYESLQCSVWTLAGSNMGLARTQPIVLSTPTAQVLKRGFHNGYNFLSVKIWFWHGKCLWSV